MLDEKNSGVNEQVKAALLIWFVGVEYSGVM
jgi:hypothetical protein